MELRANTERSFKHYALVLTSSATDCLAHVFLTWLYIIVLLIPSPQNITNACTLKRKTEKKHIQQTNSDIMCTPKQNFGRVAAI